MSYLLCPRRHASRILLGLAMPKQAWDKEKKSESQQKSNSRPSVYRLDVLTAEILGDS